jgi:guanine deaminase
MRDQATTSRRHLGEVTSSVHQDQRDESRLIKAIHSGQVIRGAWLLPHPTKRLIDHERDGVLVFDDQGVILELISASDWSIRFPDHSIPAHTRPGTLWMPGFVDTHVHYPQTAIIGSASGPLLDWLATSVFPEEARFADRSYAELIAERFCRSMLSQGTTTAAIFSSSHIGATDVLFNTLARFRLGAELGLTLMDRGAPDDVLCPADEAIADSLELIDRWHNKDDGRLRFCVTPRFGLSCTPHLLREAGRLAARHELFVQTHISENSAELTATAEAFPQARDYLAVYEEFGLLHERSLFAHCIWLSDSEWSRLAQAKASVAHCPDSNFFLGSGSMPLSESFQRQVRVGLGSDVGAGRSFSMRRACARAYDASRITSSAVSPMELLWLASRGGALALHRDDIGVIHPGAFADVICLEPPPMTMIASEEPQDLDPFAERSLETLIAQLIFCEDWDATRDVYTRGERRWSRATDSKT